MATRYKLTWKVERGKDGKVTRRRWRKRYSGREIWFNAHKGESKTDSYKRCLRLWESKKAEIDQEPHANQPWFRTLSSWIAITKSKLAELKQEDTPTNRLHWLHYSQNLKNYEHFLANGIDVGGDPDEPTLYIGSGEPTPELDNRPPWEQSEVGSLHGDALDDFVKDFLKSKEAAAKRRELSVARYEALRTGLKKFCDFLGSNRPITDLNTASLNRFREHLLQRVDKGLSAASADTTLQVVKQFTKWCYQQELIDLPRVLQSTGFNIQKPEKKIETINDSEIATLLGQAIDRTKLFILLMLNTGMTQQDIADLKHEEVDWDRGYISRKRSKTRKASGNVPTVAYKLWPQTLRLLKAERSEHEILALTNANGNPLKSVEIKDGKMRKSDNIKSAWARVKIKTGISKPPKLLRKSAATKLGEHPEFGRYAQHYLGHAPSNVADRHYVRPDQQQFDAAIKWLGEQLLKSKPQNA